MAPSTDIPENRHIRYARQQFSKGYRLHVPRSVWLHSTRSTCDVSPHTAKKIAAELGDEYGNQIIIGDAMSATKQTIVLEKREYSRNELASMAGCDQSTIRYHQDKFTSYQDGDWNTAPRLYVADDKLVAWFEERGFEVELAVQEPASAVHRNGESVHEEADTVQASGDGQSADDDWSPDDDGFKLLAPAVRQYITKIETERDEAVEARAKSESEIGKFAADARNAKNELERVSSALEEMHEKYDALEEVIRAAAERLEYSDHPDAEPRDHVIELARKLDAMKEADVRGGKIIRELEAKCERLAEKLVEREEEIEELEGKVSLQQRQLSTAADAAELAVEHAHKKGKADGHLEAEREARSYDVNKLIERSGVHVVHVIDGLQRRSNGKDPLDQLEKAYANLVLATLDGSDEHVRENRQIFHDVCGQVADRAKLLSRAARRRRFKAFFTRFVRA